MTATGHRAEFAPPPPPGLLRALVLAVLVHGLLVLLLSAGVQWKRDTEQPAVVAELWTSVPVLAAPAAPEPVPRVPPPEPPVKPAAVTEPPPAPTPDKADIAIAKE
ncbi:MAG: protein TolA, partial [Rhodoferax sp.]|nr:protein TolA [Rhodoferax sp.]